MTNAEIEAACTRARKAIEACNEYTSAENSDDPRYDFTEAGHDAIFRGKHIGEALLALADRNKRLQAVADAATPDVVEAVRNAVNFYVSYWYEIGPGESAKLQTAGPVGKLLDALAALDAGEGE